MLQNEEHNFTGFDPRFFQLALGAHSAVQQLGGGDG